MSSHSLLLTVCGCGLALAIASFRSSMLARIAFAEARVWLGWGDAARGVEWERAGRIDEQVP